MGKWKIFFGITYSPVNNGTTAIKEISSAEGRTTSRVENQYNQS